MYTPQAGQESEQPAILRQPEIIHVYEILFKHAVDFARTSRLDRMQLD